MSSSSSTDQLDQIQQDLEQLSADLTTRSDELALRDYARCDNNLKRVIQMLTMARSKPGGTPSTKRKFGFKRQVTTDTNINKHQVNVNDDVTSSSPIATTAANDPFVWPLDSITLSDKSNEFLNLEMLKHVATSTKKNPLVVANVNHCFIDLRDSKAENQTHPSPSPPSLYIHNVTDSILLLPSVMNGSVFINNVEQTIIVFCHSEFMDEEGKNQLRIHDSKRLIVVVNDNRVDNSSIRITHWTQPVIERCRDVILTNCTFIPSLPSSASSSTSSSVTSLINSTNEWTFVRDFNQPFETIPSNQIEFETHQFLKQGWIVKRRTNWSIVEFNLMKELNVSFDNDEQGNDQILPWLIQINESVKLKSDWFNVNQYQQIWSHLIQQVEMFWRSRE
ncbi:hypothetical protein OIO90_005218 [Microbotryomycetes sp. JL221]|nr:hypothetical protein OIO90_005218 [Microbotryomycetes sp. JL221]